MLFAQPQMPPNPTSLVCVWHAFADHIWFTWMLFREATFPSKLAMNFVEHPKVTCGCYCSVSFKLGPTLLGKDHKDKSHGFCPILPLSSLNSCEHAQPHQTWIYLTTLQWDSTMEKRGFVWTQNCESTQRDWPKIFINPFWNQLVSIPTTLLPLRGIHIGAGGEGRMVQDSCLWLRKTSFNFLFCHRLPVWR